MRRVRCKLVLNRETCDIEDDEGCGIDMSANDVDLLGAWVNQNDSVLWVDAQADGRFSGRFVSKKGRAAKGLTYSVHGSVNGELVSFAVNFRGDGDNLSAITSFSGRFERGANGIDRVHTIWTLARQYEDPSRSKPTHVWNTFITNADVFERREMPVD